MTANINLLLPKDNALLKRQKRVRILNSIAFLSLTIIGLLSFLIFILVKNADSPALKKEQSALLSQISQFQDKQAKLFVINNRSFLCISYV